MADHVAGVTDMVLTPEMRAEMRRAAESTGPGFRVAVCAGYQRALLDERDRLERERDVWAETAEGRANRYRVAEAALAAERERTGAMAEALEPFIQTADYLGVSDDAVTRNARRVLAEYRKGNADG